MPRAKVSNLPLSSYLLRVSEQSVLAPTCGRWFHSTKDSLISNYKPSWTIRFWNNFQNPQKIELIVFPFFHSTQPFSPNPGPIIVCAIDAAIEQPLGPGISTLPNAGIFVKNCGLFFGKRIMSHLKNICQIESCPICIRLQKTKNLLILFANFPKKKMGKPENLRTVISTPIIVNSIGSAFVKLPETWKQPPFSLFGCPVGR